MTTELSYRNEGANVYAQDGTLVCIAVDPLDAEVLAGLLRWKVDIHPEPAPEPDPWPTEPLIVASVDGGAPQLLVIQDDYTAMTMTGALCRRDRNTLTNVTPVTVVAAAALPVLWSALEQWLNGPRDALDNDMRRLAGAVVGLREQIDALGLDQ